MPREKITLVLGAGASLAMDYPLGEELRTEIMVYAATTYAPYINTANGDISDHNIQTFVDAFRTSQMASIDAFLSRRVEFAEVGKRAIAAILLSKEKRALLANCQHEDHWYFRFYNDVVSSHPWDKLDFSFLSVVTFNYDRSFEHYLMHALASAYGKTLAEAYAKVAQINIIHMYGMLGSCDPSAQHYRAYGEPISRESVAFAANQLKVIPETRTEDKTIASARESLFNADRIAFLGFGFDEMNLQRLDSEVTCVAQLPQNNDGDRVLGVRKIAATCYGKTQAEIAKFNKKTANYPIASAEAFLNCSCKELLARTLIHEI